MPKMTKFKIKLPGEINIEDIGTVQKIIEYGLNKCVTDVDMEYYNDNEKKITFRSGSVFIGMIPKAWLKVIEK